MGSHEYIHKVVSCYCPYFSGKKFLLLDLGWLRYEIMMSRLEPKLLTHRQAREVAIESNFPRRCEMSDYVICVRNVHKNKFGAEPGETRFLEIPGQVKTMKTSQVTEKRKIGLKKY